MLKAIVCISVAVLLLVVFFSYNVDAQIAPTNSATISGSVSDSAGKPVASAKVSLSGPKNTATQTDAQGQFVFVGVPYGNYQISTAATGLGTATRSISVQGDTNVAIQYEPVSQNGLKVIAQVSSSANARFNVTPASITQVNPITNAFEGKTSWRTILEQIPGVAQAGLLDGCAGFAAFPDGPMVPMQISINGALPYETATLFDNMPLIGGGATSAGSGTNLALYPLNGFGAADVVRGPGANAPSIVDSIGGSFVLHVPGAVSRNNYTMSLSTDPYGGIIANALAAVRWKKLSAVVTYGVNDSPGPFHNAEIFPNQFPFISAVNGQSFSPYIPPCVSPCQYGSYLLNPNYAGFPLYGFQEGFLVGGVNTNSAWSQHSGSIALTYALSSSVNAELFYVGQVSAAAGMGQAHTVNFIPPAGYTATLPAGQSFLFDCLRNFLGDGTFNGQSSSLLEEKITAQIGHGELRLAALQNRTFYGGSLSTPTSENLRLYGGGYLNGSPTLTVFNGGIYNVTYPFFNCFTSSWTDNRDMLFSYETQLGENVHAGASFVKSYYNMPLEATFDYGGGTVFNLGIPSSVSQTTNELRLFIGGNPSEKTSLDLSAYFVNANYHVPDPTSYVLLCTLNPANYIDTRYTYAAPRLGFVWRPTASIAVRASAGGGFAEAPLSDLVGSSGIPQLGSGGFYTVTLTNLNLQPEKSFAFDLGTDIRLHHDTVVSVDVYRSDLYGQLYNSTSVTGTYLGLPLYTTQYGNLGKSRYEGILLDVRHNIPRGLYWSLSGGLTRGYVVSVPADFYNTAGGTCNPATGANCTNLTVVPNVNFNGTFAASIPYAQGLGTLGYRWNAEKYADLVATYYGNNNTYFHPAFVELDGNVGYPLTKHASLLVTFRNITGVYDSPVQTFSSGNIIGAPTISGLPYPEFGEMYGPRTILLSTQFHL